jgi:hypothetical protein
LCLCLALGATELSASAASYSQIEPVGHAAIGGYFADTCGRDMTHRIEDAMADGDRMVFSQMCTYPTGERVACQATLHLAGGAIARQTMLIVWDA